MPPPPVPLKRDNNTMITSPLLRQRFLHENTEMNLRQNLCGHCGLEGNTRLGINKNQLNAV